MPVPPLSVSGRFRPELLFRPRSVAVIGSGSLEGREVLGNIQAGGFAGPVFEAEEPGEIAAFPDAPDLALICTDAVGDALARLAARGTRAAVVTSMARDLSALAGKAGLRAYGPGSFGIAVPGIGLHAIRSHIRPRPGRAALVSQSAALCRAVLDWAEPNGVGFSHVVGVGGGAQLGFALVLDWLSRDSDTGVILLDIRGIRDPRRFLSAARAAAQLRPVVAIRPGVRLLDAEGAANATLLAALRRVGVLCVDAFEDLLAAAETLTRARAPRSEALAIVTNAVGPARLAADAVLREGLMLAPLAPETRTILGMTLPPDAIGDEIAYVGPDDPIRLAEAAALLAGAREVGGVLIVHAPGSPSDPAAMSAIVAAARAIRVPLLVCAMGETTGAAHRRTLAAEGVAEFAAPEQAVRGFAHLVQNRRNRAAARELPSRGALTVAPDHGQVEALLRRVRADGRTTMWRHETRAVLAAYGIPNSTDHAGGMDRELRVRTWLDPVFGPAISLSGVAAPLSEAAIDLPPLNLTLAHALIGRMRDAAILASSAQRVAADLDAIADTLVRVSQLLLDCPEIAALDIHPLLASNTGVNAADATLRLRADGDPVWHLSLPPYPAELIASFGPPDQAVTVRPIRPEDAAAHAALFARLSPEDIRFRFFATLRALSPEQIARMTQIDYDREMAFVAVRDVGGDGAAETVGIGRLVQDGEAPEGEFAVLVDPAWKGRGLASHLMHRLIDWARTRGMTQIVGQVLAENAPMLAFVRRLGMTVHPMRDDPSVMEARLALEP